MKKLYRSEKNKVIAGVCGGIAGYFNVDPTLIRAGVVLATIFSGFFLGVLAYIILIFVIPSDNVHDVIEAEVVNKK